MMALRALTLLLAVLFAPAASAHTQSYGFLSVTLDETSAAGRLELAVRDLDRVYGLDADQNGEITWGEFRRREAEIATASLGRITVGAADAPCRLAGEPAMIDSRGGEPYVVIPFRGVCPPPNGPITLGYNVLTLLIGIFATSSAKRPLKENVFDAVKVVTAFTLSHSLALGLAAFGILSVPTALTESLIAITITLAALNNIWPLVSKRLWMVAFGFGLVHGLGFANVLAELNLPLDSLLAALFAFNIGVELGQLAILFAALPVIAIVMRQLSFGRRALPAANLAIAVIGAMWLADRTLGTAIPPF